HLVGAGEQAIGHGKAQRFRGLEIDSEFVLGRCLHRKVGRLLASEDAVDVRGRTPVAELPMMGLRQGSDHRSAPARTPRWRSTSPGSRTSIGRNSTPSGCAAAWMIAY